MDAGVGTVVAVGAGVAGEGADGAAGVRTGAATGAGAGPGIDGVPGADLGAGTGFWAEPGGGGAGARGGATHADKLTATANSNGVTLARLNERDIFICG